MPGYDADYESSDRRYRRVGAHKIDAGSMQVGSMTAFITYAMMIVMAFLMLTAMSIMLPRAAVAAERIDEVIRTESSIEDAKNPEMNKRTQRCDPFFTCQLPLSGSGGRCVGGY